jgi:hypothetical protein
VNHCESVDWWAKGGYGGRKTWGFGGGGACDEVEGTGQLVDRLVALDNDGWPGKGQSHRNPFSATCGFAFWNGTAEAATDCWLLWIMSVRGFRTSEEMESASLMSEFFSHCE